MYKFLLIFINREYKNLLFIAIGAVPGSLIRWQVNNDFLVNIIGAAVLGFLLGASCSRNFKLTLGVGFCGALTTFSGWMLDSAQLLISGLLLKAFSLIFYTLGLGLLAAVLGFWLGKKIKLLRHFQ